MTYINTISQGCEIWGIWIFYGCTGIGGLVNHGDYGFICRRIGKIEENTLGKGHPGSKCKDVCITRKTRKWNARQAQNPLRR